MNRADGVTEKPSQSIRAEAAAWIVRLHGPDRTQEDEESFRRWLTANRSHAVAFERMTTLWEAGTRLKSDALTQLKAVAPSDPGASRTFGRMGWIAAVLALCVGGVLWYSAAGKLATGIGEQRILNLQDGTRVTLNTSTQLAVRFDRNQRRIALDHGEALFEVSNQPGRPFVVVAGGREITALGTAFVVRRDPQRLSVTLVEGKVAVSDVAPSAPSSPPSDPSAKNARDNLKVLSAGQRLTLVDREVPKLDEPVIDDAIAWREGIIAMDRMTLSAAVAEMNRYSTVPLVVEGLDAQSIQVSGMFKAGYSLEFARALARSHGLRAEDAGARIVLSNKMER